MTANQEKYRLERQDPRWQKKRLQIMERDEFKCVDCEDSTATLNVHHSYYVKGRKCWQYPLFALKTLCHKCHTKHHSEINEDEEFNYFEWEDTIDFINGGAPCEYGFTWDLGFEFYRTSERVGRGYLMGQVLRFMVSLQRDTEDTK